MKALACIALSLVTFSLAAAQERPGAWLKGIKWSSMPTGDDMVEAYPRRAWAGGKGGWAVMGCRIGEDRRLTGCKIAAEAPEGYGFGEATLALAPRFRLQNPSDGSSVQGRRVRIPVTWQSPDAEGQHPPKTYPAGDPSMIVTVAKGVLEKRRTFPCPSEAAPDRMCLGLPITWTTRPEIEELAPLIRKAGDGASILECSVEASGALEKCAAASSPQSVSDKELLSLAKLFKAQTAPDTETSVVGKRVMLTFDWKVLRKALEVFEAT